MYPLLNQINQPADLRSLQIPELTQLGKELRKFIISSVSTTGGHLAPSLGVVELTLALHYALNTPEDKIVWDVGHQTYAHKILTGRRDQFSTLRQYKGIAGFPKRNESEFDVFDVGHSSTSISGGLGLAAARDLAGDDYSVVSVIGDGALTGGLAYEGLNNAGAAGKDFTVILNDNTMSISPNVGAIANYLTSIISNPFYNRVKKEIWEATGRFDGMGTVIRKTAKRMEESLKALATPGAFFERLGFRYFGPIDGHNISRLIHLLRETKKMKGPILIHILTKKGKGFGPAENNASIFHGLGKFDPETGQVIKDSKIPSYTKVFGETVVDLASQNEKIVGITAAMQIGTGLSAMQEAYPDRFHDVGIAEGHAVTFSAGLACGGYRPVCAIYSSFLQRAYDNVFHDVALQKLPVIFGVDRAGIVGEDGPTHHGVFDIAYLRTLPNMVIMAPKDENELRNMLYTATRYEEGPIALRYPRGQGVGVEMKSTYEQLPIGKSERLVDGDNIIMIALGYMVQPALEAAQHIREQYGVKVGVINARFVKPIDEDMLIHVGRHAKLVVTLEDGTIKGGLGSEIAEYFADQHYHGFDMIRIGIPDEFIEQGSREILYDDLGMTAPKIVDRIRQNEVFTTLANTVWQENFSQQTS